MTDRILSPRDQADGLRRMFAERRQRHVPVVSNPHIAFGGVLLERLCSAFADRGVSTLVVDAGERAGEAGEMAMVDIGQCIERLSPRVSYLPARGLPLRFVDTTGSTRGLLGAIAEATPETQVVLLHASAPELCRLFSQRRSNAGEAPAPILLAEDQPDSVTHAYAAMKLLSQRAGLPVFDLLLGAGAKSPRAARIADKLTSCADTFFAAVLRDWATVDPAGDATEPTGPGLDRLITHRLGTLPLPRPGRAPQRSIAATSPAHP